MKKCQKKLRLNRETLGSLDGSALGQARGGNEWTGCFSGCTECPGDPKTTGGTFVPFDAAAAF